LTTEKYSEDQTYGLRLNWLVYDFGRTSATRERMAQARRAAELSATAVNEALHWQLARVFQAAAHADRLAAATQEQVSIAERKFTEQTRNYRQGLRSESDLVASEVDLGRARIAHADAVASARAAAIKLAQIVDGDATRQRMARTGALRTAPDVAKLVATWTAPSSSTADAVRAAERAALEADAERVGADLLPTLSVTGQVEDSGSFQPLARSGSAQLQLAWTVPWNGQNRLEAEQIAIKRSQLDLQEQSDRESRRELELVGSDQLAAASANWEAYERQLKLAEKQRQLTENRYRTGKASALELSSSEAAVISAKLDRVRLSHLAVLAAIDVAEARGVGPDAKLLQQLFD
jgi:outer membrane protein